MQTQKGKTKQEEIYLLEVCSAGFFLSVPLVPGYLFSISGVLSTQLQQEQIFPITNSQ